MNNHTISNSLLVAQKKFVHSSIIKESDLESIFMLSRIHDIITNSPRFSTLTANAHPHGITPLVSEFHPLSAKHLHNG
jgi:hypothetical protein